MKLINDEKKQNKIYEQVKELKSIRSLLNNGKESLAIVELEKIVNKYPKNYIIKLEYAKILSKSIRNNESLELLNYLEKFCLNKFSNIEKFTLYYRMVLAYFYNEEYEKVIYYYHKVLKCKDYGELNIKEFRIFLIYSLKKLNKLKHVNKNRLRYSEQQVVDYDEKKAIDHIKFHLNEFNKYADESLFRDDIDIEKLYYTASEKVKTSKRICQSYVMDIYNFKYNNIGVYKDKKVSILQVVCISGTNNIISMYPTEGSTKNLEELVELDFNDVKTISQIEKFKTKYKGRV